MRFVLVENIDKNLFFPESTGQRDKKGRMVHTMLGSYSEAWGNV